MDLSRRNILIAAAAALAVAGGTFVLLRGDSRDADDGGRARATSPTDTARTDTGPANGRAKGRKQRRERARGPRGAGTRLKSFRGGGPLIGLADNVAANITDPRFRRSGIRRVRVAVPFDDVALGGARRAYQDGWFKAARQVGVEPLVSFYRSTRGTGILPSEAQFRRHVRRFRARYPWVRHFSTWNEANFRAQPTGRDPARTAAFYRILRDECSGGRCTVITCDFRPDGTVQSARWLETFKRGIGGGRHIWGLAPYVDVNRRSTELTRDFLARTSGPAVGQRGRRAQLLRQGRPAQPQAAGAGDVVPGGRLSAACRRGSSGPTSTTRRAARRQLDLFDSGPLDTDVCPRPAYHRFLARDRARR